MASFTVSGQTLTGRAVRVRWRSRDERPEPVGRLLDGDPDLVALVEADAELGEAHRPTPTSAPLVVRLDDPTSVLVALDARLRPGYSVDGDLPPDPADHELAPGEVA